MVPHIPEDAPFTPEQRSWLNGFFAGLLSVREASSIEARHQQESAASTGPTLTLVFGSQTGTAEGLARMASKRLRAKGFTTHPQALDDLDAGSLSSVRTLLIITSTYGDGEMPDNAQAFWEMLSSEDAPRLEQTAYSVLALGDSSYADFCQAGKDVDARLEALGARRLSERIDCDVDVDEPFETWISGLEAKLREYRDTEAAGPSALAA